MPESAAKYFARIYFVSPNHACAWILHSYPSLEYFIHCARNFYFWLL